jgi:hypothetical protein
VVSKSAILTWTSRNQTAKEPETGNRKRETGNEERSGIGIRSFVSRFSFYSSVLLKTLRADAPFAFLVVMLVANTPWRLEGGGVTAS